MVVTLAFTLHLLNSVGDISPSALIMYGIFVFVTIFAYTSLMDGSLAGPVAESVKLALGLWLIYSNHGQWFHAGTLFNGATVVVILYLILSAVMALFFYIADRPFEQDILPEAG